MKRSRIAAASVLVLALAAGHLPADEVKGKVKSVDADKNAMVVTINDADQAYAVAGDAKVVGLAGKKAKLKDIVGGLQGVRPGSEVVLTTQAKDGKPEVVQVRVEGVRAKKKKKVK